MPFVAIAVLVTLVKKTVDFAKELLPNTIQNKVVQLVAWAVATGYVFLFAASGSLGDIEIVSAGQTKYHLSQLNSAALVLVGLAIGAGAGVLNDAIERRNPDASPDGTDGP